MRPVRPLPSLPVQQRRGRHRALARLCTLAAALALAAAHPGTAQAGVAKPRAEESGSAQRTTAPATPRQGGVQAGAPSSPRCAAGNLRWAATSNSAYLSGPVTCTLAEIKRLQPKVLLEQVQPGVWLLGANLRVERGAKLEVHGQRHGGDVRELRLASGAGGAVSVRADWGTLDFRGVKVTSWDPAAGGPDVNPADGRAFIHARSRLDPDGSTARESRMDVIDSDVGYLGHNAAEAYGLTWKVCCTPSQALFAKVNVLGDVVGSRLHHNWFGAYTYGGFGMRFERNQVDHNAMYGLDPHDDSDRLVIRGNHVHSNGNHGIICSQRCDHLLIEGNRVEGNRGNGIMLHRGVTATTVRANQVSGSADSGVAVFDSHGNTILNNKLTGNLRGIRLSVGSSGNEFRGNQVGGSRQYGLYVYKGNDPAAAGDGRPKGNRLADNVISGSGGYAAYLENADGNLLAGTRLSGNANGLRLTAGRDNRVSGLHAPAGVLIETLGTATVRARTLLDEVDAARVRSNAYSQTVLTDTDGQVFALGQGIATVTTRQGSQVTLGGAQTRGGLPVATHPLWARPHYGQAQVTPAAGTGGATAQGGTTLRWTVRADSATQPIDFTVGSLQPGRSYTVTRDGRPLTTATARDTLRFTDRPGKRQQPVVYEVTPA